MPELRDYQIEDAIKLSKRSAMGCFNEPRTGKTPTSLAACHLKKCKKILIVCPASALYPWQNEFETWYKQNCVVADGTLKKRKEIIRTQWTNGLVISYDSLKQTAKSTGVVADILAAKPDAIIIDEAHRIKNPKSATTKAIFALKSIPYRLALTGTPAPNRSYEVWSILHFLYPNTFKSYWDFIETHYNTALRQNAQGSYFKDILGMRTESKKYIQRVLNEISTRRKRKDVMEWLPDKEHRVIKLPLNKYQQKYLDDLETCFETEHVVTQGVLDRLIRYRQVCLAPALLELKGTSPKIEWIKQYCKDYPEKSILVFSKFTSFLHLLKKEVPEAELIVGATPSKQREDIRKRFQAGEIKLLLINIDAGKEALTLDRASVTIFTDKFPPVGDIEQAEDRFVATTKEKADKGHEIIDLIMKDSYEEIILRMIKHRKEESDIINNYKEYLERNKTNGNHR